MRTILILAVHCVLYSSAASADSIRFVQEGWTTGATLDVVFFGHDANADGAIVQSELTSFEANWANPLGVATTWSLSDIEPDGFAFTSLDNFIFFTRNVDFSLVNVVFEGEALASVFDAFLFPVDSTATAPVAVPEPSGLAASGLAALALCRWLRSARRRT
jgi:hypothetical protein